MAPTQLIFGAGSFVPDFDIKSAEDAQPWLDVLLKTKDLVSGIDTSSLYRSSEDFLGQLRFGSHFAIGTKLPGEARPDQLSTKETVIAQTKERLSKLHMEQVFYSIPSAYKLTVS